MRLLHCRTRGRPRMRQARIPAAASAAYEACIAAAAPRSLREAAAMRLLLLRTRLRPWERQARLRRGYKIVLLRGAALIPQKIK